MRMLFGIQSRRLIIEIANTNRVPVLTVSRNTRKEKNTPYKKKKKTLHYRKHALITAIAVEREHNVYLEEGGFESVIDFPSLCTRSVGNVVGLGKREAVQNCVVSFLSRFFFFFLFLLLFQKSYSDNSSVSKADSQ